MTTQRIVRLAFTAVFATSVFLTCLHRPIDAAVQDVVVSNDADDAEEAGQEMDAKTLQLVTGGHLGGEVDVGSSDLELTYDKSFQTVGVRFSGIAIPPGARIRAAWIQFVCDETKDGAVAKLTIRAEASPDAAPFAEIDRNISSRVTTEASVEWSPQAWTRVGDAGPKQRTPDLKTLVQEVVDRAGWTEGGSMAFIVTGQGKRVAGAQDGGKPAMLHLEWQTREYGVQFAEASMEGPEDDQLAVLKVELSKRATIPISVDYAIENVTADASDYSGAGARGVLTFPPGATTQSVKLRIIDDRLPEQAERFRVALSNVVGGSLDAGLDGNTELTYTILDSSPRVTFAEAESNGDESAGVAAFDVVLTKKWDKEVTVDYQIVPERTTAQPHDYTVQGDGRLIFKAGETRKAVSISVADDEEHERTETICLTLLTAHEAVLGDLLQHRHRVLASDVGLDWPMWRCDSGRTSATPVALPRVLKQQWALQLPKLKPAWPPGDGAVTGTENLGIQDGRQRRQTFDIAYAPIVLGKTMFVGSSFDDCLRAYDTETAREKWRFYTDAPIRFAPAAWRNRVVVASDDGNVYCLDANDGSLCWQFRGGPSNRKVIGNSRLGSAWPIRGGPAIDDGIVYFAAGIWPFMGTFVYALDVEKGTELWVNDGNAFNFMQSPHSGAWSFSGIAPQGYIAVGHRKLIVPNGRAVAAAFDRKTGALEYFHLAQHNRNGTAHAAIAGDVWQGSCMLFHVEDGSSKKQMLDGAVLTDTVIYESLVKEVEDPGPSGVRARNSGDLAVRWEYVGPMNTEVFCKAGEVVYAGAPDRVLAIKDLGESCELVWEKTIAGVPKGMLAGDGKLLVVTESGCIYCFGQGADNMSRPAVRPEVEKTPVADEWPARARAIVAQTEQREGYCLVLGVGTGRLMEELARQQPRMCVIGLDRDVDKVDALRRRWGQYDISHERLSVQVGDIVTAGLPPYLANLIVSEDLAEAERLVSARGAAGDDLVEKAFASLRPYGGKICLPSALLPTLQHAVTAARLANAETYRSGDFAILERSGALPGAADWTHQYADAANTVMSEDTLVKAPLGLLWYGGSSHQQILPRHRHGPAQHVVGGRLFIEGPDLMRAVDVYTGRILWESKLPDVGHDYVKRPIIRANEAHEPGANHVGSNFATATDGVYIAYGRKCLRLDPATGETLAAFTLPGDTAFGQVKIWNDLLIVAADPLLFDDRPPGEANWNKTCSKDLVGLNRFHGDVVWRRAAENAFHHNSIIVGGGKVFCIDRLPPGEEAKSGRRGQQPQQISERYRLLALDAKTGEVSWTASEGIFGTWLGYYQQDDVLIQSGRKSPDMIAGEPTGRVIAYHGSDGQVLWDKQSDVDDGPYLLAHSRIYMQNSQYNPSNALDIRTGDEVMITHPLTGLRTPWHFMRNKGCNYVVGCENLLTFRSGTAAYYNLTNNGGIGHLGGFKSGCTSNLIPANGVLSAPDYTRSCNCSYPSQTSLALVYTPDVEVWTHGAADSPTGPIQRAGVNFGAPGDHLSEDNTLWMEFPTPSYGDTPAAGFTYPNIEVSTTPSEPHVFRHHSSRVTGDPPRWVTASGVMGVTQVAIGLAGEHEREFRVRLFFAEPEAIAGGQRVFSVLLQDREVLSNFDIVRSAGRSRHGIVREFRDVIAKDKLVVKLVPAADAPRPQPLLCGIEVVVEPERGSAAHTEVPKPF